MKNEMKRLTGACVRLNGETEKKVKEKTLKNISVFFVFLLLLNDSKLQTLHSNDIANLPLKNK